MVTISDLPPETLGNIAKFLPTADDAFKLAQTSTAMFQALSPAIVRAEGFVARYGKEGAARKLHWLTHDEDAWGLRWLQCPGNLETAKYVFGMVEDCFSGHNLRFDVAVAIETELASRGDKLVLTEHHRPIVRTQDILRIYRYQDRNLLERLCSAVEAGFKPSLDVFGPSHPIAISDVPDTADVLTEMLQIVAPPSIRAFPIQGDFGDVFLRHYRDEIESDATTRLWARRHARPDYFAEVDPLRTKTPEELAQRILELIKDSTDTSRSFAWAEWVDLMDSGMVDLAQIVPTRIEHLVKATMHPCVAMSLIEALDERDDGKAMYQRIDALCVEVLDRYMTHRREFYGQTDEPDTEEGRVAFREFFMLSVVESWKNRVRNRLGIKGSWTKASVFAPIWSMNL